MTAPQQIHKTDGVSAQQLQAEAAYNADVAANAAEFKRIAEFRQHADDGTDSVSVEELRSRGAAIEEAEFYAAQDNVALHRRYLELMTARKPELDAYRQKTAANLEKVFTTIAKKLNGLGVSPESLPAWASNPRAAEVQFGHKVRESADWRNANAIAEDAKMQATVAATLLRDAPARLAAAEAECRAIARRIVGLPTNERSPVHLAA